MAESEWIIILAMGGFIIYAVYSFLRNVWNYFTYNPKTSVKKWKEQSEAANLNLTIDTIGGQVHCINSRRRSSVREVYIVSKYKPLLAKILVLFSFSLLMYLLLPLLGRG